MSTHRAALEAKHATAVDALARADVGLRAAMLAHDPDLVAPTEVAVTFRRFEAVLELGRDLEFARLFGAYRRAWRAERKARSAAHAARFAPVATAPAQMRKPEARYRRLAEQRMEARAA